MIEPDSDTGAGRVPVPSVFHGRRNFRRQQLNPPRVAVLTRVDGNGKCPPPVGQRQHPFASMSMTRARAEQIGVSPELSMLQKSKLATPSLTYREYQQIPLNLLMEDFSGNAKPIALIIRAAGFADI